MPVYMKVDGIVQKPSARPFAGAAAFADEIRKLYPRGVGMVLISESSSERFVAGKTNGGIIAILIGLLLPAVQKFESGVHGDMNVLKGVLGPAGQIAIAMGDGSVKPVGGAVGPPRVRKMEELSW